MLLGGGGEEEVRWALEEAAGRSRVARIGKGKDSVVRAEADGKAGLYYVGDSEGCGPGV